MNRILKDYVIPSLLWCAVAVYIVFAAGVARNRFGEATVTGIDIEVVDSSGQRRLVTSEMVGGWISASGIGAVGTPVREVDMGGIERTIASNGFVGDVAAYASADGMLHVEVSQRTPMVRLLVDGYNRYVTEEGFVFGTPASSAMYVPVVTGGYKPPFPPSFEGSARSWTDSLVEGSQGLDIELKRLRKEREELLTKRSEIEARIKSHNRKKPKKRWLESDSDWKAREQWAMAGWNDERQKKQDSVRRNRAETARLDERMTATAEARKKTYKNYEDFVKLLNFVERMEDDGFWRAEIVQIVVDRGSGGELRVELVPRSGSFTIEFGEMENVDDKLARLLRFYREGLNSYGWEAFRSISVAYEGQVVCRK